jgi:hypothetical protein
MAAVSRNPGIPLDDEPMDFDLGDLPTDEELEAAGEAGPAISDGPGDEPASDGGSSVLGLIQLWVVLVSLAYFLIGWAVGFLMAFRGAAQVGFEALTHPQFYLIVFFWPIAVWQLFFKQF